MTASHTPGPWTIELYGEPDYPTQVIHSNHENRVCFMATAGSSGDPAMIEADARLIAAAPDLLAALSDILAFGVDSWDAGKHLDAVDRARLAIAKATSP